MISLQMETGNVPDRSDDISVSTGPQYVIDRYGADQKAIRYDGNIVLKPVLFRSRNARGF